MHVVTRTSCPVVFAVLFASSALAQFEADDVLVSDPASDLPDPEFDVIDNHFVWQDTAGALWMARLNPVTGELLPNDGRGLLLDLNLRNIGLSGNGPEWGYGDGKPYIAYTRDIDDTEENFVLGGGMQLPDFTWDINLLGNSFNRWRPEGTAPSHRGEPRIVYNYTLSDGSDAVGWRNLFDAASEGSVTGPELQSQGGRWVEGEDTYLVLLRDGTFQFGAVDINTLPEEYRQITTGGNKINPFSWWAPEFDEPLFSAMILKNDRHHIGIFRRNSSDPTAWDLYYEFAIPSPNYPFVSSPEVFTINGKSYVVTVAASELGTDLFKFQPKGPSEIWIAGIDPDNPFFQRIDDPSADFENQPQRSEPEVYNTATGPVVYYTELLEQGAQKIRLVRKAATGFGPEWGYDDQHYAGPWGTVNRDNRNSGETPFPIADSYEEAGVEAVDNLQSVRGVMDAEGRLYITMRRQSAGSSIPEFRALDTRNGNAEVFSLTDAELSSGFFNTNALTDAMGNVYITSESQLTKLTPAGEIVWNMPIPGLARALQFASDGRIVMFTWNGWFLSVDPETGADVRQDLTPDRQYGNSAAICLAGGQPGRCAYLDAPAVNPKTNAIYVTYTTPRGNGRVEAWQYDAGTRQITSLWSSAVFGGNVTAPVLSADYDRLYVQSSNGRLVAIAADTGAAAWSTALGFTTSKPVAPVVNAFGYILPGGDAADSSTLGYVGILRDLGDTFEWSFISGDYAALSPAAAGRGNRFALMAERRSDGQPVMLVLNPYHGVISALPWTDGALPEDYSGVTLREDGWLFVGTSGATSLKAYRPIWPQF